MNLLETKFINDGEMLRSAGKESQLSTHVNNILLTKFYVWF